ncbi:MAG TPA: cyclic lactone autoinducer peptide [Oscillospiraceae bacterium]|nr:cyclic lactone autoinducer peptide [Oscillospiraceae bacterium]
MKRILAFAAKLLMLLAPIALTTAITSAGTMCALWTYQPQAPESLSKIVK